MTGNKSLLKNLFQHIKSRKLFPAIPLNELVYRLKDLHAAGFELSENEKHYPVKMEIDEILSKALHNAELKLADYYLYKQKLDTSEIEMLKLALKDLINDLRDGGTIPGLFDYLKIHIPELNKTAYEKRYQNILEYIFKSIRKEIGDKISEKRG